MLFSLKNKLKADKQNTSFNNFAMFAQLSRKQLEVFGLSLYFAVITLCFAVYLGQLSSQRKQVIDEAVKIKEKSANFNETQCNLLRDFLYQRTNFVALRYAFRCFIGGYIAAGFESKIAKSAGITAVMIYFGLSVALEIYKMAIDNEIALFPNKSKLT